MTENTSQVENTGVSISEQIDRTSVNIFAFSALNPETGLPVNIPNILGGEDIISDDVAKLKVEEAFGQLNIQSVFGFEDHTIQSCLYDTFHVGDDGQKRLTPHIYLLKSHKNNVYLLNLLTTPYADLNLDAYFFEVSFMSRSFSGVFRRSLKQVELGQIDEDRQDDICREAVENLSGFMHHQIFYERGLRSMVEGETKKSTAMILGMFVELSIIQLEFQCMGDCGKTFEKDQPSFVGVEQSDVKCPDCGGKLVLAPPVIKYENIQFIYPSGSAKFLAKHNPEDILPTKYFGYLSGILMPRNIALTTNRLSPEHFSSLATIPAKASFSDKEDPREYVSISTQWRPKGDKIFLFTSVGNSKYVNDRSIGFIPQLTAITINRQIIEGLEKGKELPFIIQSSIISDWKLTEKIKIPDIEKYLSFEDIPTVGGIKL